MKIVSERPTFQGDLMLRRVAEADVPFNRLRPAPVTGSVYILAHSETGHHHVVAERAAQLLIDETNEFIAWLRVVELCEVEHLRDWDKHESLYLRPGFYEVRRQREIDDDGLWRQVAD